MAHQDDLNTYDAVLKEMFQSVGRSVGVHVLLLIVERALWVVQHEYEEAALITYSEEGVSLNGLASLDQDRADQIAHHLVVNIVDTLGRLVGKQLAERMLEALNRSGQEVQTLPDHTSRAPGKGHEVPTGVHLL